MVHPASEAAQWAADARDVMSFITFEGVEGVGKSTQVKLLTDSLRASGIDCIATREPGGTVFGERVRALALQPESPSPMAELLLMFAARAVHLEEVIRPALASGRWVVCDRFTDASFAYQGAGRGLPFDLIESLKQHVEQSTEPDLTILLDLEPELGRERAAARDSQNKAKDRFETQSAEFFTRVRAAYLERAARFSDRFIVVDAARPIGAVHEAICDAVRARCSRAVSG